MLYLNSIKNRNIRGKKISHMENTSVNIKTKKKRWEMRTTASVFVPKIHHMVANIYNALKFASLQNLMETCNENRS